MRKFKKGDKIVITSMLDEFSLENDDLKHNHGVILEVINSDMKDGKGKHLHPSPYTRMGLYDYLLIELPDKTIINLFDDSVALLY